MKGSPALRRAGAKRLARRVCYGPQDNSGGLGIHGIIQSAAPKAWVVNLTNPSGLITQAVLDAGFDRIVGICDGQLSS